MPQLEAPFEYDSLAVSREVDIMIVRIDTASPMNGVTRRFVDELRDLAAELRADDSIRAVALTGTNGVYSAGADLDGLAGDEGDATRLRYLAGTLHDAIVALVGLEVPLVTAVNGVAAGGGFGLAILGDIVIISDDARLEFAYPRIGLTGDAGSTFFLPRLVGLRRAREIALRDEPIAPDEAVDLGLASEVVPAEELESRRRAVTEELAAGPTRAYGATKRLLLESYDRDLSAQLTAETDAIAAAARTDDYEHGYAAFFGDDDPQFEGR